MAVTEESQQARRSWGPIALITSVVGLVTMGFTSPVALIISLMALRQKPRWQGLLALLFSLVGFAFGVHRLQLAAKSFGTQDTLVDLELRLKTYHDDFKRYPEDADFERLLGEVPDDWGNPIRYRITAEGYELRSAGPDEVMETADDLRGGPEPESKN